MKAFISEAPTIIGEHRTELGETPIWCERSQSLLWVDILQQKLFRFWPQNNNVIDTRLMPPFTSAVLLTELDEVFIVVSQTGIFLFDYDRFTWKKLAPYPQDSQETTSRPNEAGISPDGVLWFSTMDIAARKPIGTWYTFKCGDLNAQQVLTGHWVPNTLLWYQDKLWLADSLQACFYNFNVVDTVLHNESKCLVDGVPDGSALTSDGYILNVNWGMASLVNYKISNDGLISAGRLSLPSKQPTSCVFGGPNFSDLYITSAYENIISPSIWDGALLRLSTSLIGVAANRFRF